VVLNEGFQSAFWAVVVLAGIGVALALLLLARPRTTPGERLEARPGSRPQRRRSRQATSHGAAHGQGGSGGDKRTGARV
jgi:hypothetical protein